MVNRVLKFTEIRKAVPPTKSGEKIVDEYKLTYNDDGTSEIIPCGKRNIYAEIQSHADSVDLHKIIEQCMITGDDSALYKTKGFYADLVGFPTNYAEALQKLNEAEIVFKKLPVEVKEKFDNDVNQFFATAFTDGWMNKIGMVKESEVVDQVVKEEVKSDE